MRVYRGVIDGFSGSWGSGLGYLVISGVPVPCDNGATVRALEACFGDVIGEGHCVDGEGGHVGQEIVYSMDEFGLVMGWFTPVEEWEELGRPEVPPGPEGAEVEYDEEVGEFVIVEEVEA